MSYLVKKSVNIPVLLTRGIRTKETAEALINGDYADLIGIARSLYKNHKWEE